MVWNNTNTKEICEIVDVDAVMDVDVDEVVDDFDIYVVVDIDVILVDVDSVVSIVVDKHHLSYCSYRYPQKQKGEVNPTGKVLNLGNLLLRNALES